MLLNCGAQADMIIQLNNDVIKSAKEIIQEIDKDNK